MLKILDDLRNDERTKDEKIIGITEDTYSGSEYERFLTLDAAFEGAAKKKLLRKRMSS